MRVLLPRLLAPVAVLLAATACGSAPSTPAPGTSTPATSAQPASVPTGPSVTGTYAFVEKNEQTLCDFLESDGKRYHLIYGGTAGHGVLAGGANGAPVLSFIYLGQDATGTTVGADPAAYASRPDVIAVGEKMTGYGTLTAPAAADPCAPYDQVLTVTALAPA